MEVEELRPIPTIEYNYMLPPWVVFGGLVPRKRGRKNKKRSAADMEDDIDEDEQDENQSRQPTTYVDGSSTRITPSTSTTHAITSCCCEYCY